MDTVATPIQSNAGLASWITRWVHPQHGLLREISLLPKLPGTPPLYRVIAMSGDQHVARGALNYAAGAGCKSGFGAGNDLQSACWASIGEAIERYSAGIYRDADLVLSTARELGTLADPIHEMIYREKPFGRPTRTYALFDSDVRRRWTIATRLSDGVSFYVPAQMVWFGYERVNAEESIGLISSNGVAAGRSPEQAIISGSLELIERDSLMCHWYSGSTPHHVIRDEFIELLDCETQHFIRERGLEINPAYLVNEFGIPVIFCLICDDSQGVIGTGCSASFSASKACRKAFSEAFVIYMHQLEKKNAGEGIPDPDVIEGFSDHVSAYRSKSLWDNLDAFRSPPGVISLADAERLSQPLVHLTAPEQLSALSKRLNAHGFEILVVQMTRSDVAAAGFNVVRAIIPGLQPLLLGPVYPLDDRRLKTFARRNLHHEVRPTMKLHPLA